MLELNGSSYHKLLQGAEAALATAEAALRERPQDETLLRQRDERRGELRYERQVSSRLVLVDVGLDAEALRRAWTDRQKHVVLAARLTPYQSGDGPSYSAGIQLDGDRISVPRQYREIFAEWQRRSYDENGPKVQVEVAFGQRHEPWLISARQ